MSSYEQYNIFYGKNWQTRDTSLDQYEYSGWALGELIRQGERVLHVNCGSNPFKYMIPNFCGIDPVNPQADIVISLQDYATHYRTTRFNVAFCLDAFDGTEDYVASQIALLVQTMLTRDTRIYWRTSTVGTYPWTFAEHSRLASKFNYHVVGATYDANNTIYAEWDSNKTSLETVS